LNKSW